MTRTMYRYTGQPLRFFAGLLLLGLASALWAQAPQRPPRPELPPSVWLLTQSQHLIQINAAHPRRALQRLPIRGLQAGDELVAIDYRVARGLLYGLARSGRLYVIQPRTGQAQVVNAAAALLALDQGPVGFDFNPAADRIRVVQSNSSNHRLHPDSAQVVDFDAATTGIQPDPSLRFVAGDPHAGQTPDVVAAGYTYNAQDERLTSNFAIERRFGLLVLQGSREGVQPVVSPNTGLLSTVGSLGLGALVDVQFDISDFGNVALIAATTPTSVLPRLYRIDLASGAATLLGSVAGGQPLAGMAIEP